jgi:hypothetical protein
MRANPDEIRSIGEGLMNNTTAGSNPQPTTLSGGQLGQALASAHNAKAPTANAFLASVYEGMTQAANTLVGFGLGTRDIDQDGANEIDSADG